MKHKAPYNLRRHRWLSKHVRKVIDCFAQAKKTVQIEEEKQANSFLDAWDQVDTNELENKHHSRNRSVDMLIEPVISTELLIREILNKDCNDEIVMEFVKQQVETKSY